MAQTNLEAAEKQNPDSKPLEQPNARIGFLKRYRRLPRNVVSIGLVSLLNDSSSEIIYPLLPIFLSFSLGASPAAIGVIEGLAESISSLLKLFSGYFSDRRGKRKIFVTIGYGLASVARPLLAFATSWTQVLAIRVSDRIGKGIRSAPRDAMIADSTRVEDRGLAFGFHRAMDHTGAVFGPLIAFGVIHLVAANGSNLTRLDYNTIFLSASIPAIAAMFVILFLVHESPAVPRNGDVKQAELPKLSLAGYDPVFKRFLVLVGLFTLSNSSDAFLLLRANQAGVSGESTLLLWAALHVSKVASSIVGGAVSDHLGRRFMIVSGWLLYAAVYFGFAFVTKPWMAWALFLVYGIYFGLAEGAEKALVADLVRPDQRGTAFGLYNFAFGITVFPASLLMGIIWKVFGPQAAFIFSAILGALAGLLLLALVRPPHPRGDEQFSTGNA